METIKMSPITSHRSRIHLTKTHLAFLGLITLFILLWITTKSSTLVSGDNNKCLVSFGKYSGSNYNKPSETLNNKCLVESRWMRLAQHSVLLPNKDEAVNDWLWIDYHNRINVLVEAPPTRRDAPHEKSFMILSQTKYALDDTSLAVVGGIIEPGEEALKAAQREVLEELSVACENWEALGRFRTDVNRGMGWVYPYLARDCTDNASNSDTVGGTNTNEIGGRDAEKQNVHIMQLSDVKKAVMEGKFVEVQWSNTVSLAMLHYLSLNE